MKFVFTKGDYAQYRGRTFLWGKPTDIQDKATIEALLRHPDYRKDEDEETQTEAAPEVLADPHACPKCGRVLRQGMYLHQKYCKG